MDLSGLNERQKEAVLQTEGPVMIVAGAGSGKTRVLTYRIAYLLELGIKARNILAVTFTNKAALEMKTRVYNIVGEEANKLWVSTFHSMGAKILRRHIHILGYPTNFDIIDEDDSISVIKEIMKNLNIDVKEYPAKYVRNYISKKKNYDSLAIDENKIRVLDLIYNNYQSQLFRDALVDFDDLLLLTYRLFNENPNVLDFYQENFQYIMVDEFQDTNALQYKLVMLMSKKYRNIFIVGDQDQSIYSFRGAKVENINYFFNDFKDCKKIILNQNYRSTQNILSIANSVIRNNQNRVKKDLFSDNQKGDLVIYNRLKSQYEESSYVVSEIDRLIRKGYKYSDIAVFYRANSMSRNLEEVFNRYGVPYVIYGGLPFFSRKEIKDIIAYLRLMVNPNNGWAFRRVYNTPKRGLGKESFQKLVDYAYQIDIPFMEAIGGADLSKMAQGRFASFRQLIEEMREEFLKIPFSQYLDFIVDKSGYLDMLKEDGDEGMDRYDNVKEFKSIMTNAYEYYDGSDMEKLEQLLDELALKVDTDYEPSENSVSMMTYHQAKGLEFDVVFMVAMEENIFPSWGSSLSMNELEEERRICYVGMTRARKQLYLTCAEARMMYGEFRQNRPSIFIKEMDKDIVKSLCEKPAEKTVTYQASKKTESNFKNETKNDGSFLVGDKINHQAFGDGVIVAKEGDTITVAFCAEHGIKKLLSWHPMIKKI